MLKQRKGLSRLKQPIDNCKGRVEGILERGEQFLIENLITDKPVQGEKTPSVWFVEEECATGMRTLRGNVIVEELFWLYQVHDEIAPNTFN